MARNPLVLADVYPALSMPQSDAGNLRVLEQRARARGVDVHVLTVQPGDPIPAADLYQVGGAADEDLAELAQRLAEERVLLDAVRSGAVLLAIDAGYQVAGQSFCSPDGVEHAGLGLLDVRSTLGPLVDGPVVGSPGLAPDLPELVGFESHGGRTILGPGVRPFASLEVGVGNGGSPATDGALGGRVIGTYVHGPLLAWNPAIADLVLAMVLDEPIGPSSDASAFREQVRATRAAEARASRRD